jgi:Pyruvate/2-oxoacid:ferredoxin oxidoreductase gamma subunit
MEHEIMITGIGGQGVQLGAQILARAATLERREVLYLGTYGGTMRGGNTDASLVIADAPIHTPPIVSELGAALAMHHAFWPPLAEKLRPGALALINSTVFEGELGRDDVRRENVAATELATALGNPLGASMILIAAFASLTGLLALESLLEAMRESVPSYRQQHIASNELALREGYAAVEAGACRLAFAAPNTAAAGVAL